MNTESFQLPKDILSQIREILNQDKETNLTFEDGVDPNLQHYFDKNFKLTFEDVLAIRASEEIELLSKIKPEPYGSIDLPINHGRSMSDLPVYKYRSEILKKVNEKTFLLIIGETGCGKTTQIPQMILDNCIKTGNKHLCNIICTQPRRISAVSVAERVAYERSEILGKSVGYQIRLETVLPEKGGSILFCTTGVLLRKMESDPLLSNISHVILDEIHERTVESDILMGLLKTICKYNKTLKVIMMSATFGVEQFAHHYLDDCSQLEMEGKLFPVEEKYLEDILEMISFQFDSYTPRRPFMYNARDAMRNAEKEKEMKNFSDFIEEYTNTLRKEGKYSWRVIEALKNPNSEEINLDLLKMLIFYIGTNEPEGAILVFLPGYDKISKLWELIENSVDFSIDKYVVYMLHSIMPTDEQKGIFDNPPNGIRKIILATNIAETSITINDVVYVINSGRVKIKEYDTKKDYETLQEKWIAKSQAKQRAGRAGRCQPGICYNFYTRMRETTFKDYQIPEIQRSKLEPMILNLKMMKINNVLEFFESLLSSPQQKSVENGIKLLKRMNALDDNEFITPLGLQLARLPLDPQVAKMLVTAAIFKCVDPITSIAATISLKEPFYRPVKKEKQLKEIKMSFANNSRSDHLMYANTLKEYEMSANKRHFCKENFITNRNINELKNLKKQLWEHLNEIGFISNNSNDNTENVDLLRAVIAAGFYPNIAVITNTKLVKYKVKKTIITPEDGEQVKINKWTVNGEQDEFPSKYLTYCNKKKANTDIFLNDSTMIYYTSLIIFGDKFATTTLLNIPYISVGGGIFKFVTDFETLEVIMILRKRFEALLAKMALNPSDAEKDNNLKEALILFFSQK